MNIERVAISPFLSVLFVLILFFIYLTSRKYEIEKLLVFKKQNDFLIEISRKLDILIEKKNT
jgi:hypothetical protein